MAVEDNRAMEWRRLHAVPIHKALSLHGFADLVTRHGHLNTSPELEDVTAGTQRDPVAQGTTKRAAPAEVVLAPRSRTPQYLLASLVIGVCAVWGGLRWSGVLDAGAPAWAGLLGLPLALALWRYKPGGSVHPINVQQWVESLAGSVKEAEGHQHDRLMGGDSEAINLRYYRASVPSREARYAAPSGQMRSDSNYPDLPDIAAYYRTLHPRRLVITGDSGSGKTTLAVQLILDLLEAREEGDPDPVPVRIPLAEWDTSRSLHDQLTEYLFFAYRLPKRWASQIVKAGRVLPVLDGLDEMDPPLSDGNPDPAAPRARALLNKLKGYQFGGKPAPVVITCRAENYDAVAKGSVNLPGIRLRDAAQIKIELLEPQQARSYLAARAFTDPDRWATLLSEVSERPKAPLSRLLSTPWRLCMAATIYAEEGDPGEMTRLQTADSLDHHLLSHYIAATVSLHSRVGKRHARRDESTYRAHRVHRWLHPIARYLTSGEGKSRGLLSLPDLWRLTTPVYHAVMIFQAILIYSLAYLLFKISPWLHPVGRPDQVPVTCAALALLGLLMAMGPARRFLSPRQIFRKYPAGAVVGAMIPPLCLILSGSGILRGILTAVILLLITWQGLALVVHPGTEVIRPRDILKDDFKSSIVYALIAGFAANLVDGLLAHASTLNIPFAVGAALFTVPMFGGPTVRHGVFLLVARGVAPLRIGAFLDWAVDAGILRLAGPAYQFRHRELQEWLATHPRPSHSAQTELKSI
ncbi:NACHT domain-containing protein [Streptomyces sp. NPDC004009]